ncbi:MAG: DUF1667 domain-containing protein [Clostridia bacterium]|nr:DUF1667 domain-containing protein [Clostridia bacterium]
MEKTYTCINCPLGCQVKAVISEGKVISLSGNTCEKGEKYVVKEVERPSRLVTSTVKVIGGRGPLVSVRTREEIPKEHIFDVMDEINKVVLKAPVGLGDVIIKDIFGTDVISTCEMEEK